ncbi:MAG: S8 family serine peptidase [Actinomycetota bacterium]|nr:S8 family serine peptidase [Actinomycetota bacterium]
MRGGAALATVALATALLGMPTDRAVAVDPSCGTSAEGTLLEVGLPWAQEMYDPDNRLAPFSTGAGVTVAVVDSGVDATHPQLLGKVLPGVGYVPGLPTGTIDCVPHGTGVASIIAAQSIPTFGFAGLAPDATILPVRVSDKSYLAPAEELQDPLTLAAGIDYAVANGADVIAVSTVCYFDSPELEAATEGAIAAGVVVVAAVGNGQQDGDLDPSPIIVPFPAAYPDVIGVGAVDQNMARDGTSQIGAFVDLVAPGVDVVAAGLGGHQRYSDTGIAVGFVAATVALMLGQPDSELRDLRGAQLVDRVTGRLLASASGAVGGPGELAYGRGSVDPYRALTEAPDDAAPLELDGRQPPPRDEAAIRLAAERAAADSSSMRNALLMIVFALVVIAAAFFVPRARRRRWRPGRERELQSERADKRPEFLPGDMLFRTSAETPDKVAPR